VVRNKMKNKKTKMMKLDQTRIKTIFNDKKESDNQKEHGRTISIENLPECALKNQLLMIAEKEAIICIVAVRHNENGSWVAYSGYPDVKDLKIKDTQDNSVMFWNCEHIRSVENVKMLGEIIDIETAAKLFPDWDRNKYKVM
jgi:hypothetical protein